MTEQGASDILARLAALARKAPGAAVWRFLYHLRNGRSRNLALLALENPRGLFQREPSTAENRYPLIFRYVAERLKEAPAPSLLSFGCATGEEVFTLRRYLPAATVKGIDINRRNIRACDRRLAAIGGDVGLSFALADSAAGEPCAHYDAIFAMAVFRDGRLGAAPSRCDHLIRFIDFERSVELLARSLKPGGLLALRHANFRFADTSLAAGFRLVLAAPHFGEPTPIYGPDDRLIPDALGDDGVFEKI
jgi:SAM-dependent methyltransferase